MKAALKWKDDKLITKWKEVKKILKEETQAAERVKMLEKEVDERKKSKQLC